MLTAEDRTETNPSAGGAPALGALRASWIAAVYLVGAACIGFVLAAAFQLVWLVCFHEVQQHATALGNAVSSPAALMAGALAYRMARRSFALEAGDEFRRALGLHPAPWPQLVVAAAAGIAFFACNALSTAYLLRHLPGHTIAELTEPAAAAAGWSRAFWSIYVLCVTPLVEEFIFRGVLFAGLLRSTSVAFAACTSTFAFALMHAVTWKPSGLLGVLILGALAQWARIRSASLLPGIALHLSYNLGCVILAYT